MSRPWILIPIIVLSGGCAVAPALDQAPAWSFSKDLDYFDRLEIGAREQEAILAPLHRAARNEQFVGVQQRVERELRFCDRFVLLQEIWEGGLEFAGGWLCKPAGSERLAAGKFGLNDDGEGFVVALNKVDLLNLAKSIRLLAGEKVVNVDRFQTMDGVTAVATYFDAGLVRRSFYAPPAVDLDHVSEESADRYEGFDRFYVGFMKVLEGECTLDCF